METKRTKKAAPREKLVQLPIGFTARHREMIEEIMKDAGYFPSLASVVQQAVVEMHKRMKVTSLVKEELEAREKAAIEQYKKDHPDEEE